MARRALVTRACACSTVLAGAATSPGVCTRPKVLARLARPSLAGADAMYPPKTADAAYPASLGATYDTAGAGDVVLAAMLAGTGVMSSTNRSSQETSLSA